MKGLHSEIETLRERLRNHFRIDDYEREKLLQEDLEKVASASKLLQIPEFRFFQISYFQWYGREISENHFEVIFSEYMFQDIVPHWVRHFARIVMSRNEDGGIDPGEYNIERPKTTHELKSAGFGYIAILSIVVVVFCIMLAGHVPL